MSYLDLFQNPSPEKPAPAPVIFVATDMTVITISDSRSSLDTVTENAKRYRRLTPEYWAWFYHKYHLMEQALTHGKITEKTFVEILNRISALYNHALALYGRDTLKHAEATLDFKEYDSRMKSGGTQSGQSRSSQMPAKAPSIVVSRS